MKAATSPPSTGKEPSVTNGAKASLMTGRAAHDAADQGDDEQLEHLQGVRARTQELIRRLTSAGAAAQAPGLAAPDQSSAPMLLPPVVGHSGTACPEGQAPSPERIAATPKSSCGSSSSSATACPSDSSLNSALSASSGSLGARAVYPCDSTPAPDCPTSCLPRLTMPASIAGRGGSISSTRGPSSSPSKAPHTRQGSSGPQAAADGAASREESDSASPHAWLRAQRQRTEELLNHMQRASMWCTPLGVADPQ